MNFLGNVVGGQIIKYANVNIEDMKKAFTKVKGVAIEASSTVEQQGQPKADSEYNEAINLGKIIVNKDNFSTYNYFYFRIYFLVYTIFNPIQFNGNSDSVALYLDGSDYNFIHIPILDVSG